VTATQRKSHLYMTYSSNLLNCTVAYACSCAGGGYRRGSAEGVLGCHPRNILKRSFDAKSPVGRQFEPENKLIEGQPNEYDVICRNASVLAFHLSPTIFAGTPFRLRNICRNGVLPRFRTTTVHPCSRYDTRCCFNVRPEADMSQLNLLHGTNN